jgi:predicted DsbA family dithiol-disulfide isomerase
MTPGIMPTQTITGNTIGARRLRIDVWSDISCPWCYIGTHRLEAAVTASSHADAIDLVARSFELVPNASCDPQPSLQVVTDVMGVSLQAATTLEARVAVLARSENLGYVLNRPHANSFDLHRALQLATSHGVGFPLLTALQSALFGDGRNVYDHAFLATAATAVGVPRTRVEEVLAGDEYGDTVRADEDEARRIGVTGVPFVVIDGRGAIAGTTSIEGYAEAIEKGWTEV